MPVRCEPVRQEGVALAEPVRQIPRGLRGDKQGRRRAGYERSAMAIQMAQFATLCKRRSSDIHSAALFSYDGPALLSYGFPVDGEARLTAF